MERLSRFLLPFALLLLLNGCSPWDEVQVRDPRLDELEWSSEGEGSRNVDVWIQAEVENPNRTSFKIVGTDLKLFLDEQKVGKAELQENVKIPGNSEGTHRFHVRAALNDIAAGGLKALGSMVGGSSPQLRIKGSIKGRAYGIFTKRFPVDESKRIRISDILGFRRASRWSITGIPNSPLAFR